MRWLRPSLSPLESVVLDVVAGCLTGASVMAVVTTTPFWPHGGCGTGVNDPMEYALGMVPFGFRCLLVAAVGRWGRSGRATGRGFEVVAGKR